MPVAYFDTNIYGMLVKHPRSWPAVRSFLLDGGFLLGLSRANVLELSDANSLVRPLSRFLITMPFVILKPFEMIVDEEAQAYPEERDETLILGSIVQNPNGLDNIESLLLQHPERLDAGRGIWQRNSQQGLRRHSTISLRDLLVSIM